EAHLIHYANAAFCRLAGTSQQALTGRPFAEAMPQGDSCLAVLDRVYRTGEAEIHGESGEPDPHSVFRSYAVWPLPDKTGRTAGLAIQVTETEKFHRNANELTEALLLSSVRQHENAEAAENLNGMLRMEITHRRRMEDALRESEARLAKELAAMQSLQRVSTFMIRKGGPDALYQRIMDTAVAMMGSDAASMQVLDEGDARLRLLAWRGFHPDSAKFWQQVSLESESSCGAALRSQRRIVVPDVETCAAMANTQDLEFYRKSGFRAVQSTPLVSRDGRLLGMISTHWRAPHQPANDDLRLFDVLARQAADLVERGLSDEAQARMEEQRQRALAFDEAVMANMSEGLYTTDRHGLVTSMNPAAETLFGWRFEELKGLRMHDMTHHRRPDGSPYPAEECAGLHVLETGEAVIDQEDFFIRKDGSVFPVVYSASPLRDRGAIAGKVVIFHDITERKQASDRERALAGELAHRNRNLLTVIQAIVARTLTDQHTPAENRLALMHRLEALARSQKILESGGFEGAPLAEVIRLELESFTGRYQMAGPDLALNPKAAQTFALLVHELATNATKHGALSNPGGRIAIDWSAEGGDDGGRFKFRWRERGGPPVLPPNRKGFGRVLIEKVAAQEFGAAPRIGFAPEGLSYEIETPLPVVAAGP
ncbi:MAG TPA: PAS domain S-box protein, partial [Rhizomicrobium sp.]|nr:PAS domain S-box protein [Rhizomicrobium sp.]